MSFGKLQFSASTLLTHSLLGFSVFDSDYTHEETIHYVTHYMLLLCSIWGKIIRTTVIVSYICTL